MMNRDEFCQDKADKPINYRTQPHRITSRLVAAAWRNGNVGGRINEVTLRRARLVLGWVTVFGG